MPDARKEPHDRKIQDLSASPASASSHGDIDIIPKKASQSHMPPPVKFADASGGVGMVKVLNKFISQHH